MVSTAVLSSHYKFAVPAFSTMKAKLWPPGQKYYVNNLKITFCLGYNLTFHSRQQSDMSLSVCLFWSNLLCHFQKQSVISLSATLCYALSGAICYVTLTQDQSVMSLSGPICYVTLRTNLLCTLRTNLLCHSQDWYRVTGIE